MLDETDRTEKHVYLQHGNAKADGAVVREREGVPPAGGAEEHVRNITRRAVPVVLQCTTRNDISTLPVGFLAMI